MRYTTIIDCRPLPCYRNKNARLVYLHLVLACGYHDSDRDLTEISVRSLAADVCISVGAVRAALKSLEKSRLIERSGTVTRVRKWVPSEDISKRPRNKAQQVSQDAQRAREMADQERERRSEETRLQREEMAQRGTSPYIEYVEGLMKKAEQGDEQAKAALPRHMKRYQEAKQIMEQERKGGQQHG